MRFANFSNRYKVNVISDCFCKCAQKTVLPVTKKWRKKLQPPTRILYLCIAHRK